MIDRPPCWPEYGPAPNACAAAHYRRRIHGTQDLPGDWNGWRLRGRHLISPSGERITVMELDRLLYRRARFGPWL